MPNKKLSQLKLNINSPLLKRSFDISKPAIIPFGMENALSKKKEEKEEGDSKQGNNQGKKEYTHLCLMERKIIHKMIKKGYCLADIARHLGRGKQAIALEVRRNGGRDQYQPSKAQKLSMERKAARDLKCSESIKNRINKTTASLERIENLEMQIDILVEAIKGLKNGKN